jgi:hypothetical protein
MAEYQTPVDVANRALQHCGASRIDPLLGFAEISKNASETSFCYGKLRQAELRRNVWTFATRRTAIRAIDSGTMLLVPALWSQGTTYFVGSIVSDQYGNPWISKVPNNTGNDPLASTTWEPYFGPLTVSLYAAATSYFSGEVVYTTSGNGTARTYVSLQNGNTDNPATGTPYDATAVYSKNQVVTYLAVAYMSLINFNTGKTPSAAPALWDIATTYAAGASVGGSDGAIYTSVGAGNIANDPTADNGVNWTNTGVLNPWTTVFVSGAGSSKWRQIGGAEFPMGVGLTTLDIIYPVGAGPSAQGAGRNIFMLPAGFLRLGAQNPKGTTTWLGGPSGVTYNDWNFENGLLITAESGPIPLRCVVDITDVRKMDAMFCEGLAARVGMEVCEPLTQSTSKLGTIAKVYDEWMSQARAVNAIEQSYDDPPDDEYVTVRN